MDSQIPSSLKHTKSHQVVAGENRRGPREHAEQAQGGLAAAAEIEASFLHEFRIDSNARLVECATEATQPLPGIGDGEGTRDRSQTAMPELDHVARGLVCAVFVGDKHRV